MSHFYSNKIDTEKAKDAVAAYATAKIQLDILDGYLQDLRTSIDEKTDEIGNGDFIEKFAMNKLWNLLKGVRGDIWASSFAELDEVVENIN